MLFPCFAKGYIHTHHVPEYVAVLKNLENFQHSLYYSLTHSLSLTLTHYGQWYSAIYKQSPGVSSVGRYIILRQHRKIVSVHGPAGSRHMTVAIWVGGHPWLLCCTMWERVFQVRGSVTIQSPIPLSILCQWWDWLGSHLTQHLSRCVVSQRFIWDYEHGAGGSVIHLHTGAYNRWRLNDARSSYLRTIDNSTQVTTF